MKNNSPIQTVLFDSNTHECCGVMSDGYVSHRPRHYLMNEWRGQKASIVVELGTCKGPGVYTAHAIFAYQCALVNGDIVDISRLTPLDSHTNQPISLSVS